MKTRSHDRVQLELAATGARTCVFSNRLCLTRPRVSWDPQRRALSSPGRPTTTMSDRLGQISGHLSNNFGRGLLNGEVAIITGTCNCVRAVALVLKCCRYNAGAAQVRIQTNYFYE
jgi:hypothetical protein